MPARNKSKYEHEHDTEDIPEEPEPLEVYNRPSWFVQTKFNHENDTEDLPDDPFIDTKINYIEPPENIDLQTKYDHLKDTDDLPEGLDPPGYV